MALQSGHRFTVSMAEAFPDGLYAMGVQQAEDYDAKTKRRTPSKDKQTNELVWAVTCIDRDPNARAKQVQIKVLAARCPELPPEIIPDSGIRPVEFSGLVVTPYLEEKGSGESKRSNLVFSYRATGVHAQGKAPHVPARATAPAEGKAA